MNMRALKNRNIRSWGTRGSLIYSRLLTTVLLLFSLAIVSATSSVAEAGTQIDGGTAVGNISGDHALGYPGQRHLVRDSDGYWYAIWVGIDTDNKNVYLNKSINTAGTTWDTAIVLFGNGGILYSSTCYNWNFPSIAIDRTNGKLHIVVQRDNDYLYYSKCID